MSVYTVSSGKRVICKALRLFEAKERILEEMDGMKAGEEMDIHIWREA